MQAAWEVRVQRKALTVDNDGNGLMDSKSIRSDESRDLLEGEVLGELIIVDNIDNLDVQTKVLDESLGHGGTEGLRGNDVSDCTF